MFINAYKSDKTAASLQIPPLLGILITIILIHSTIKREKNCFHDIIRRQKNEGSFSEQMKSLCWILRLFDKEII